MASAEDLKGVLDFLNITSAYVFSHDKGVGMATALAVKHPLLVRRLGLSEYSLPGLGYEEVPDLAEFLMSGKERQFLQWYLFHGSYSGPASFSEDTVNRYATSISKPGFLRAMLGPFSSATVAADASFFKGVFDSQRTLSIPVLAMGGEASVGNELALKQFFESIASDLEVDIIPKAGHWIADENPEWVANRVLKFLAGDDSALPAVDLSYLKDLVTLKVGYFVTLRNAAIGGLQIS
ncbi:hypothetical protein DL766_001795 [Monosporascus sp. MC13-8B]|nr:hypothetical protein DL766_001795 [Monosporascus sp. MC13-8B]